MTVAEIIKVWLEANGYDGLYTDGCGCENSDLMPCGNNPDICEAGYKASCPGPENCAAEGDCPWHICGVKQTNMDKEPKDGKENNSL